MQVQLNLREVAEPIGNVDFIELLRFGGHGLV
jgi:hypothetical protein